MAVIKKREEWLSGTAIFHLDEVEGVGRLFELEYVTEDPEKDEQVFHDLIAQFAPHLGDVATSSNAQLVNNAVVK